jgi:hypothetical protein
LLIIVKQSEIPNKFGNKVAVRKVKKPSLFGRSKGRKEGVKNRAILQENSTKKPRNERSYSEWKNNGFE